MICAFAILYRVTGNYRYLAVAEKNYQFIEEYLAEGNILYVSCRNRIHSAKGFLDDYAYYGAALLCLYDVTAKPDYLKRAEQILRESKRQFEDRDGGGYFLYGAENGMLITRPKETYDGALPSGNSVMAYCLVRLSLLDAGKGYEEEAERQLAFLSGEAQGYPAGYGLFQTTLLMYLNPPEKITVVLSGEKPGEILVQLPLYADVRMLPEAMDDYHLLNGRTTYYVCKNHTCLPPTNEPFG